MKIFFTLKKFFFIYKKRKDTKRNTKSARSEPMENLPPEIIYYIGDFLGAEKISFSLTCKRLNQVLKKDVKKIKRQLINLKKKATYTFTLLRVNDKESTIKMRSTSLVISKFLDLHLVEEKYILKHMRKLLEVEPEIIYYDEHNLRKFNYKNAKKFLRLLSKLIFNTIYYGPAISKVWNMLFELELLYERTSKGLEELIDKLKDLVFSYLKTQVP
jgi:hypothetical protein